MMQAEKQEHEKERFPFLVLAFIFVSLFVILCCLLVVYPQENMFSFEVEKEKYALKPMNCPGHW